MACRRDNKTISISGSIKFSLFLHPGLCPAAWVCVSVMQRARRTCVYIHHFVLVLHNSSAALRAQPCCMIRIVSLGLRCPRFDWGYSESILPLTVRQVVARASLFHILWWGEWGVVFRVAWVSLLWVSSVTRRNTKQSWSNIFIICIMSTL